MTRLFFNGHTYEFVAAARTWQDASSYAQGQGGHLAVITSAAENNAIIQAALADTSLVSSAPTANDGGGAKYLWLGATDLVVEGRFAWVTGESFSLYSAWAAGPLGREPDDYGGQQDALAMALEVYPRPSGGIGSAGLWNDLNERDTLFSIIEYDELRGTNASETIQAGAGADTVRGLGGDDTLDGGAGIDTLALSGSKADYSITFKSSGVYKITDNRTGSPDGDDTLTNFEVVNYNGALFPFLSSIASSVRSGFQSALRQDPYANFSSTNPVASGASAGDFNSLIKTAEVSGFSLQQAQAKVIELARQTTSVATIAYEFFTGSTPSSAGLDYLVSPTGVNANNLNSAYYQNFGLENRYINFAVNLGKNGEGKAAFAAGYSSLSLFDATRKAYTTLFGSTPSDTKLHALLDPTFAVNGTTMTRSDYFAYYGGDGPNGIGTKAAMVGWLMSEAVKADVGIYATANDLYLTDLANGKSVYAVDLVGVYHGTPFIST